MKKHIPLLFLYLLFLSSCVTSSISSRPNNVSAEGANTTTIKQGDVVYVVGKPDDVYRFGNYLKEE